MKYIAFVAAALLLSTSAFAHSGGTNSQGCHNDHKNGTYHCH
ncbi:MAG: YHYH domain-containing protein [Sphingobacteriales bacterium]|nr:MAG: YHYH domain-containing protein [Sphingobacteriales bacterium]